MDNLRRPSEPVLRRMAQAIWRYIGFGEEGWLTAPPSPQPSISDSEQPNVAARPKLRLVPAPNLPETHPSQKFRRHPQLRAQQSNLTDVERDGRHDAVRGLNAAKAGALQVARQHFSMAAYCDGVDLTAVPGFWNLTRGQMETAVEAYEAVGRYRDAAALDAHIATIYRPNLMGGDLAPIQPRKSERQALTN